MERKLSGSRKIVREAGVESTSSEPCKLLILKVLLRGTTSPVKRAAWSVRSSVPCGPSHLILLTTSLPM